MINKNNNFSWAIEQLKAGLSVRRSCWEKNHFWVIRDNELGSKRLVNSINEVPIINRNQLSANDWELYNANFNLADRVCRINGELVIRIEDFKEFIEVIERECNITYKEDWSLTPSDIRSIIDKHTRYPLR